MRRRIEAVGDLVKHPVSVDDFADMYAQTVAFALLATRLLERGDATPRDFIERMSCSAPFLEDLLEGVFPLNRPAFSSKPLRNNTPLDSKVAGTLGVPSACYGTGSVPATLVDGDLRDLWELLRRTDMDAIRAAFTDRSPAEDPVTDLYERFLHQYNPRQRIQRGVFFTPRPVVSYIVRSVHELLQSEFGLEDGLASTATWADAREIALRRDPTADFRIPAGVQPGDHFVRILDPATGTGTFLFECIEVIEGTMKERWRRELGKAHRNDPAIVALWRRYVPQYLLPRLYGYEIVTAPCAIAHLRLALKLQETGYRLQRGERLHVHLTNSLEPPPEIDQTPPADGIGRADEARTVNEVKRAQRFTVVIGNPPYAYRTANLTDSAAALVAPFRYVDGERIRERSGLSLERSLQDDFVKFLGLALRLHRETGTSVLGFITSNSYLDSPLYRGLRDQLVAAYRRLRLVDLLGDSIKDREENVFDIRKGVVILLASGAPSGGDARVELAAIHGTRDEKHRALAGQSCGGMDFTTIPAEKPDRFFLHQSGGSEYLRWPSLNGVFEATSTCVKTLRDKLATDFDRDALLGKIKRFRASRTTKEQIRKTFGVSDVVQWQIDRARKSLAGVRPEPHLVQYESRPFDRRWMFYHGAIVGSPRVPIMRHLLGRSNLAMIANRKVRTARCDHFWVTSGLCVSEVISSADNSNCFPLYLDPEQRTSQPLLDCKPNFTMGFLKQLAEGLKLPQVPPHGLPQAVSAEDIFDYAYAVFFSPEYRQRYAERLKIDFPRLPIPGSLALWRSLAALGAELVSLHLLESPSLENRIATWRGGVPSGKVEKISYARGTVWIDRARRQGFEGVPAAAWEMRVGSYQPCEKWLKDRRGRPLSAAEIAHYEKIVAALNETARLTANIDQAIAEHGGWPEALFAKECRARGHNLHNSRCEPGAMKRSVKFPCGI